MHTEAGRDFRRAVQMVGGALHPSYLARYQLKRSPDFMFRSRSMQVEAQEVQLRGVRMMAFADDSRAHLIPADVFDLLFEPLEPPTVTAPTAAHACKKAKERHPNQRPATVRRVKADRDTSNVKLRMGEAGKPIRLVDAVRDALVEGPKTNQEVKDYVAALGMNDQSTDGALFTMKKQNEASRGDDGRWRLVGGK